MVVRRKAFAYITNARRLLVFEHPDHPDAGIQVPAGTIEPGEDPADAVLREAHEETGLAGLKLAAFLGECEYGMADFGINETHHRYFYHLLSEEVSPETWMHFETNARVGDDQSPIRFRLYWVQFPGGVPNLIAGHGQMLDKLSEALARAGVG